MRNNLHERKTSLPSPPSSGPFSQETEPGISLSEGAAPRKKRKYHLNNFHHIEPSLGKKRGRSTEEQASDQSQKPCRKRNKEDPERGYQQLSKLQTAAAEEQDPIQCWARTGEWPSTFAQMSEFESEGSNKRHRSSTPSFSSRVRDGSALPAQPAAYEEELHRYGIDFDDLGSKDLLSAESQAACQALLDVGELAPAYNLCSEAIYIRMFQRASKGNEERVRRDLTPQIVPSAELLYLLDGEIALQNVREEMSGGWTKCGLLGGTQPRPDYAYGLSSAALAEDERVKLENFTSINNPTKFTESMYFTFLLCEGKMRKEEY
ncbi:hypothetical protein LTR95_014144 [Oleoguttula sp. CCFEE 5521]